MDFFGQSVKVMRPSGMEAGMRNYLSYVYRNIALALLISGIVAFGVSCSPYLMGMIFGTPLKFVVMFLPLVLALVFGFKLQSMSLESATILFFTYAASVGLSLASIFLIYTKSSIASTFFITAGTFGGMSLYGFFTKRDLTGLGSFLIMGLWGIMLASIVNIFLKSSGLNFAVSIISVFVFIGLTAYDTQKIKQMYYSFNGMDIESAKKIALMGSLSLYMDFINLFISLLRFFGQGREE
jgi:FtsH-binding integral membrane protein